MENSQLYTMKQEDPRDWLEVEKGQKETGVLPLVFCEVLLRVLKLPGVTHRQVGRTQVMKVDEN